LQVIIKSWDFMPANVIKPYATTYICHLVELVACLGLYWQSFVEGTWYLRAEGNGLQLQSTRIESLGVMVLFRVTGKSTFESNRVIPSYDIKELCFGFVPNIFDDEYDVLKLTLLFGAPENVERTLHLLGFGPEARKNWEISHAHLFSVSFEIIGMLGKTFRLRGSNFRMLPNPTRDAWQSNRGPWSKITFRLMETFIQNLKEVTSANRYLPDHPIFGILNLCNEMREIVKYGPANMKIEALEAVHNAIDSTTIYLLSIKQSFVLTIVVSHITAVLEVLGDPESRLSRMFPVYRDEGSLITFYFQNIRPRVVKPAPESNGDLSDLPTEEEIEQRDTLWICLIFRMLCWFLLHDFHEKDVNIVTSGLKRSRMPVYIG